MVYRDFIDGKVVKIGEDFVGNLEWVEGECKLL